MCVIAYQKTSQADLTYDEVLNMANRNPHGFGMMWTDGIRVCYKKGYFNVDKFYNDYIAIKHDPSVKEIALHLRIATGSNVDVANCHPFPITRNKNRIKSAEGHADVLIMMNGIIGNSTKEFSDTALYTMKNLRNYYDHDNRFFLHFTKREEFLFENEISGNRFVFMSKDGSRLFGSGWSDYENKCQVSNRHWIPIKYDYDYNYGYYNNSYKKFAPNSNGKYKSYIDYIMEGVVK